MGSASRAGRAALAAVLLATAAMAIDNRHFSFPLRVVAH